MQSHIILCMVKAHHQVASFSQIADTCDSGAQKSHDKNAEKFPQAFWAAPFSHGLLPLLLGYSLSSWATPFSTGLLPFLKGYSVL